MTGRARAQALVGAAVLFALGLGVLFLVAIAPGLAARDTVRVRVIFRELGGLREGAEVRAAAATIGKVMAISLAPGAAADEPADARAPVAADLAIARRHLPRTWRAGQFVVSARGLLGTRLLELMPPPGEPGPPLADGDVVRGVDPPTLDRVLLRTWTNLEIARRLARDLAPELSRLRRELTALALALRALEVPGAPAAPPAAPAAIDALWAEAERAWHDTLDDGAALERLGQVAARAEALAAALGAAWRELDAELASVLAGAEALLARLSGHAPGAKLAELVVAVRRLVVQVSAIRTNAVAIWDRWQRHEGTLGRLLYDPEFPEDAKALGKILKRQPWRLIGRPPEEVEAARGP